MRAGIVGLCLVLLGAAGAGGWYFYSQDDGADEGAFTVMTAVAPEPVYEPAGSPGLDSFYPLEEQLSDFVGPGQPAASATTGDTAVAGETASTGDGSPAREAATVGEAGSISDMVSGRAATAAARRTDRDQATMMMVGLDGFADVGGPDSAAIASGLYGGTVENTCDPERLISYLLNNPEKGRVWASVQAITFAELPSYIRSLTPTVLTIDTMVVNHGFDAQGFAIPIVSTLEVGSAVLVDANGDVRARCYCGNPITPYTPPYSPPKCLAYHAVVYAEPGTIETKRQGVPRSVWATNRVTNRYNVDWVEVSWGVQTGWVRADEAKARYCKPEVEYRCVASSLVASRPQTENYTGSFEGGWVEIVAFDIEGWTFVSFGGGTGWIPTSAIGPDSACVVRAACISSNVGVWTQPNESGTRIAAPGNAVRVEYTGELVGYPTVTHEKVVVTSPGPTQTGYVRTMGLTSQAEASCLPAVRCSTFDVDTIVYDSSTSDQQLGGLWWASVDVLSGPTNGRYEIDFGGQRAWVNAKDLQGSGCEPWTQCIQIYGSIYDPLPTESGTRTNPGEFIRASFSGRIYYDATTTYTEFTALEPALSPSGSAWLETSKGFNTLDNSNCGMVPQCQPGYDWDASGRCVPPKCPDGQPRTAAGACPPPPCPEGERLVFGNSIDSECCPVASLSTGLTECMPPACPGEQQLALNGECCPTEMIVSAGGVCVQPPCPSPQQTDLQGECCPGDYALDSTGQCNPCPIPTEFDTNGRCCPTGQSLSEQGFCLTPPCPGGEPRSQTGDCPPPVDMTCPTGQEMLADGTCRVPPRTCPSSQELLADGTCRVPPRTCPSGQELLADGTCRVPPRTCPSGQELLADGSCRTPATPVPTVFECPQGQMPANGVCVPLTCDIGFVLITDQCVPIECPAGALTSQFINSKCVPITCKGGYELINNDCIPVGCPDGHEQLADGTCRLPPPTCLPGETLVNNICEPIFCTFGSELIGDECLPIQCPFGTEFIGGDCQPIGCPAGSVLIKGQCQVLVPLCGVGEIEVDGNCLPVTCFTGFELVGSDCVAIQCPLNHNLVGNECIAPPVCLTDEVYNTSTSQCEPIISRSVQLVPSLAEGAAI